MTQRITRRVGGRGNLIEALRRRQKLYTEFIEWGCVKREFAVVAVELVAFEVNEALGSAAGIFISQPRLSNSFHQHQHHNFVVSTPNYWIRPFKMAAEQRKLLGI